MLDQNDTNFLYNSKDTLYQYNAIYTSYLLKLADLIRAEKVNNPPTETIGKLRIQMRMKRYISQRSGCTCHYHPRGHAVLQSRINYLLLLGYNFTS